MKIGKCFIKVSYYMFSFIMIMNVVMVLINMFYIRHQYNVATILSIIAILILFFLFKFKDKISFALKNKKIEYLVVFIIIFFSLILRLYVVKSIRIEPESDYRIYYEVANRINDGTLKEYSNQIKNTTENVFKYGFDINYLNLVDYIAKVPHVYVFSLILSFIFRAFGNNIEVGLYFGVFCNIIYIEMVYELSKRISGKFVGILSILLIAFFPSMIFYNSILGSEPIFNVIFLGCILIFFKIKEINLESKFKYYSLIILLGILSSIGCAIRPVGIIFSIAICIYYLVDSNKEKYIAILCFICISIFTSTIISKSIENSIGEPIANRSSAFGYSLMIGTNKEFDGKWNAEDYRKFFDYHDKLGSATKAQEACLKEGVKQISNNGISDLVHLILKKHKILWGNSDFAIDFNYVFMKNQGILNDNIINILNDGKIIGNIFYFICVFFTLIYSLSLLRKNDVEKEYLLVLIILGTVAAHIFLEVQNRYQYHALPIMCILGAIGIDDLFRKMQNINLIKNNSN